MPLRPWIDAWQDALYGPAGFYTRSRPAEHFRTAANGTTLLAEALAHLVREEGLAEVVDVGAGSGELLARLHGLLPDVALTGVDVVARPAPLDAAIGWRTDLPDHVDGLLLAHEWLDNLPCSVVELDEHGDVREVLVDPASGVEALGDVVADPWLDAWWSLAEPGHRAEVGDVRDDAWADAVARVDGVALAVDYAHDRGTRPPFGSLRSYADGREVDVVPDGTRDVTAHVAADSLAARVGGTVTTQRDTLAALGVDGTRPPLALATSDPAAYVTALSRAGEAAELRARGGWGDLAWVRTDTRGRARLSP